jgi:hypothetical protein
VSPERIVDTDPPEELWLAELFTAEQLDKLLPRTLWLYLVRVADRSKVTPSDRLVAMTLWSHVGKGGDAWVGQATLTAETALGERTVRRSLDSLEAGGWIERERLSRRKAMTTHLCWPNYDQLTGPETGQRGRTETGHDDRTPDAETGHSVPRPATGAASAATQTAETGHRDHRWSSEGSEDGSVETAAEFDLSELLDSAMPGRRRKVHSDAA